MSDETKITPLPDGPLLVEGVGDMRNSGGALDAKPKMALCRCGASESKPFCDGKHAAVGFSGAKLDGRGEDRVDEYAGERRSWIPMPRKKPS